MGLSQPRVVLGLLGLAAATGIWLVGLLSTDSHREVMLRALQRGLERVYDEAVKSAHAQKTEIPFPLSASALRIGLLGGKELRATLPTFVNAEDVFLPRGSVYVPSDELACVVRVLEGRLYGITGARAWREVSQGEFLAWSHEALLAHAPEIE